MKRINRNNIISFRSHSRSLIWSVKESKNDHIENQSNEPLLIANYSKRELIEITNMHSKFNLEVEFTSRSSLRVEVEED